VAVGRASSVSEKRRCRWRKGEAGDGWESDWFGVCLSCAVFLCEREASVSVFGRKRDKSMKGTSRGSKWVEVDRLPGTMWHRREERQDLTVDSDPRLGGLTVPALEGLRQENGVVMTGGPCD
jgi:hypothetical protein